MITLTPNSETTISISGGSLKPLPYKTISDLVSAERTKERSALEMTEKYKSNSDAVSVEIYTGTTSPDAASIGLKQVNEAMESYRAAQAAQYGYAATTEQYTEAGTYQRKSLAINLTTDEGDEVTITDEFRNHYRSKIYENGDSGYGANHSNTANLIVEGDLNEQEKADIGALLFKIENLQRASEKAGKNEGSTGQIDQIIADIGNGNVDNNSLSSVSVNINIDQIKHHEVKTQTRYQPQGANNITSLKSSLDSQELFALRKYQANAQTGSPYEQGLSKFANARFAEILSKYQDNEFLLNTGINLLKFNVDSARDTIRAHLHDE